MYTDYWCSTDQWTSLRKHPMKHDRPENIMNTTLLSKCGAMRSSMPNTTSNLSLNALRPPHSNLNPPLKPQTPDPPAPPVKAAHTQAPAVSPPSYLMEQRSNALACTRPPPRPHRARLLPAVQPPNSGNIGYCPYKSDRQRTIHDNNVKGYLKAAREASSMMVHSEAHHFRWQYPHTLGRMKAYNVMRVQEEERGRAMTLRTNSSGGINMAMDEKGRSLQGRLDFCERNVKTLTAGIKGVLKNHEDGCHATMELSQKVREIAAQEQFIELQEDLMAIADCTKRLAEERKKIMIDRGENKMMNVLKYISEKIVHPVKTLLKDRERAVKKYDTMARKVGVSGDSKTVLVTEAVALKHQKVANYRQCVLNTDEIVDTNFRCFEKERVVELKILLEEALRAEMLYHCRAIEILGPMCVTMRKLDPERAVQRVDGGAEGAEDHEDIKRVTRHTYVIAEPWRVYGLQALIDGYSFSLFVCSIVVKRWRAGRAIVPTTKHSMCAA